MNRHRLILALCLLLLAFAGYAAAQVCTTLTTETLCYNARSACHWDIASNGCVAGAPTNSSCYQYNRDTVGCVTATSDSAGQKCKVNPWNNYCFRPSKPCVNITGSDATCTARSDCKVVTTGVCAVATAGASLYGAAPSTCASNGYFYDAFGPVIGKQCYNALTEVQTEYPNCGIWSNYPAPSSEPCVSHGCTYDSDTGRCLTLTSDGGVSSSGAVTLSADFTVSDVAVDIVNQVMTCTVSIPASQFFNPAKPRYHVITVGTPPTASRTPAQPNVCNNLAQAHPAFDIGQPKVSPGYADTVGLTSLFLTTAQTTHNLTFDASTAAGLAIYQTIGYTKISTSSIAQSVTIPVTLDYVRQTIKISLAGAVNNCGATRTTLASYVSYDIPLSLTVREGDNVAVTTMHQSVNALTYGLVMLGATTQNSVQVSLDPVVDTAAATAYSPACALGMQRRTWTVRETWYNPNNLTIVGLRSLADVSMVASGYNQTVGSPTNCFGTAIKAVVPPTNCTNNVCTTLVRFETRCANIPVDGNGLNLCVYQTAANRIADLGSDVAYSTALNRVQSYYHYPREWTAGKEANASYVGADSSGATPDVVQVSIATSTWPDATTTAALVVDCAFLPTPTSAFSARTVATGSTDGSSTYDIRNMQLSSLGTLTTICYLRNETIRQSFTVTIDVTTTDAAHVFQITPLSSSGTVPLYSSTPIYFKDLKNEMTYTPRNVSSGTNLPLVAGALGYDGFAVPAYWLYKLLPSVGYLQRFYVTVSLPAVAGTSVVPTVVSRRLLSTRSLLQTTDASTLTGSDTTGAFSIVQDSNSTSTINVLTAALGSTSSSIKTAATTVAVVGGVAAIGVVSAFLVTAASGAGAAAAASSSAAVAAVAAVGTLGRARPRQYL